MGGRRWSDEEQKFSDWIQSHSEVSEYLINQQEKKEKKPASLIVEAALSSSWKW